MTSCKKRIADEQTFSDDGAEAIFFLGLEYWEGNGVEADIHKAKELIGRAKRKGYQLAELYWDIICAFEEADNAERG